MAQVSDVRSSGDSTNGLAGADFTRGAPATAATRAVGSHVIRVLLADDQALVRAGFRALLDAQDDIEVVGEAADGEQAAAMAALLAPDVVLMGHPHAEA